MSENYDIPGLEEHFANAGIEPEVEDESNSTETGSTGTESGASTESSDTQTSQVEGAAGKDNLSGGKNSGDKQDKEKEGKDSHSPGDLVDKNGTLIAKAGAERRHFETAQAVRQENIYVKGQLNTANQKYQNLETKYNTAMETVKAVGMEDPQQMAAAVSLFKELQTNPVQAVQNLLVELKAKGHNIEGIGDGIDTRAIQRMIDEKVGKPTSQQSTGPTPEQIDAAITQEVEQFLAEFPDALQHEAHIGALINESVKRNPQQPLSMTDAYFKFKQYVINNGYDWDKPFGPQVEAKNAPQQQQQQAPRVGGKPVPQAGATETDTDSLFDSSKASTNDIIRQAMREGGLSA